MLSSRGSSPCRNWSCASYMPCSGKRVFTTEPPGKPQRWQNDLFFLFFFFPKPFSITIIQVYVPTADAKEAEVDWFSEELQDIELTHTHTHTHTHTQCHFHHRGLEWKSWKSRDTWNNKQVWPWSTNWSRAKDNSPCIPYSPCVPCSPWDCRVGHNWVTELTELKG